MSEAGPIAMSCYDRLSQIVAEQGEKEIKVRTAIYDQVQAEKLKMEKQIAQHKIKIGESKVAMRELEGKHSKEIVIHQVNVDELNQTKHLQLQNLQKVDAKIADLEKETTRAQAEKSAIEHHIEQLESEQNNLKMLGELSRRHFTDDQKRIQTITDEEQEAVNVLQKKLLGKEKEIQKVFSTEEVLHSKFNPKNQEMIDFLIKLIDDSTAALECPVCLETTQEPTYQCLESSLKTYLLTYLPPDLFKMSA
jgi:chromosome segregation ATPase